MYVYICTYVNLRILSKTKLYDITVFSTSYSVYTRNHKTYVVLLAFYSTYKYIRIANPCNHGYVHTYVHQPFLVDQLRTSPLVRLSH